MYQLFIVLCYNRILALGIERMIREILDFIIDGRMVYINNKQWAQRKKEIEEEWWAWSDFSDLLFQTSVLFPISPIITHWSISTATGILTVNTCQLIPQLSMHFILILNSHLRFCEQVNNDIRSKLIWGRSIKTGKWGMASMHHSIHWSI